MIRRLMVVAGIAVLSAACASTSTSAAQRKANLTDPREKEPGYRYGMNPGPSPVGAIPDVMLNDAARNRDVKLSIDYPTRPGPHPLIVFSHGSGLSNRSYPGLSSHWASYGYVVIRPSHNDSTPVDDMTTTQWSDRARDITFILDSLTTLVQRYPELEGKIDTAKIGVAGHARGAMTAMMLGGLRIFPGGVSLADPRVKAVIALSPNGPNDRWGLTSDSWKEVRVPALYVTGSLDKGTTDTETPEWREEAFALSPAGDKWFVSIEGVRPVTFTGQAYAQVDDRTVASTALAANPNVDPIVARQQAQQMEMGRARTSGLGDRALFGTIRAIALGFFDTYLKGDTGGRDYLTRSDERAHIVVKTK
jgi:predicted dienelactone hydrolase